MKKMWRTLLAVILLGLAGLAYYLWKQGPTYRPAPPPAEATAPSPPAPPAVAETAVQYPVPEQTDKPLPPLAESDAVARDALSDLFGAKAVKQLFAPQEVIRRIVVTIDNLPRKVVSAQLMPTRPIESRLRTSGEGDALMLSPSNYERYTPYVRLAAMVDAKVFAAVYVRLYPLFQQAYRDLGYPKGYFNDRLVAVIDHLLDAPQSTGQIALVQPHVFYRFVDPELESLSAGHKLMLRIGNDNAAIVKKKLREIRKELVSLGPEVK